jgi:hypothetical protein
MPYAPSGSNSNRRRRGRRRYKALNLYSWHTARNYQHLTGINDLYFVYIFLKILGLFYFAWIVNSFVI